MNQDIKERIEQIQKGIVPEGYKKTKVAIIPEEWNVRRVKDFVCLLNDKHNPEKSGEFFPCIELEHIESDTGMLTGITDTKTVKSLKNKFKEKNILYGKLRPYLRKYYFAKFNGVCSTEIWVLSPKNKNIDEKYLFYLVQTEYFNYHANISTGSSMPRADWNYVSLINFGLPSLYEQQRIASILETWDRAIELKEKLIQEKQTQKKGLMEKLLTGEVRLQGYKGAWVDVKIKDIGSLKGGSSFPEKYQNNKHGKYPFFKVSDMNIENNVKYLFDAKHYITEEIRDEIKAGVAQRNSIVFAKVGAAIFLERKRLLSSDSCIDNNMMALTVNENNDYQYIYYLLANMKLSKFANTGALPSLNSNDIYNIKCKIPVDYHEQKSIAKILTMVDREIQFLQRELSLLKQQKKGLMQLLLTGIIRV